MFNDLRCIVLVVIQLVFAMGAYAQSTVFEVGRATNIIIDGKTTDWNDTGLQINLFAPHENFNPSADDFTPRCRFAWDERGLILLATVRDDVHTEAGSEADIWRADAIELFMADKVGGTQRLQLLIAPGMDQKHPDMRFHLNNQSAVKADGVVQIQPKIVRTHDGKTYTLEALVPWGILGIKPSVGMSLGLQIFFNDVDGDESRGQLLWYPGAGTYGDSTQMQSVKLTEQSGMPINASATATIQHMKWVNVNVQAMGSMVNQPVTLKLPNGAGLHQTLEPHGEMAVATFRYALDRKSNRGGQNVLVQFDSKQSADCPVQIPDMDQQRVDMLMKTQLRFEPSTIFGTANLPTCDFAQPLVMEQVLGDYKIKTTYYDANFQEVTSAPEPGRYAAVVRITAQDGKVHTRYRSLYRMPKDMHAWDMKFEADIQLPDAYGIDPTVTKAAKQFVNDAYHWSFWDIAQNASYNAALLSSLTAIKPGSDVTVYTGPMTLEKQYWTTLERKLNGNDKMFTRNFAIPARLDKPAPVLHAGTMAEAGMTDDAPQKIDAILTQWAGDTDEAFIACVVRNGVIVHHKAYGTRDGKPMTTDTLSWMASLSKLISGTMAMMMVEQQLINLDTPIDRYLPEMQNAGFNQVPTLRNLWTHTAGTTSHRGEDDPDLEHLIAEMAPTLHVGKKFEYDGMGLELGIQLLGQISGQCYPTMVKTHLLDPLGCEVTECQNASWNTRSTAMDMAKIGQMLLNGGSYGLHRFMSPQTRDAMLPIDISTITSDKSATKYGIGTQWFTGDGLSDQCFAHGAASSATLRIDLKNNLVISMTRDNAGQNFSKYHPQFIKTVTDCMINP